MRRRINSKRLSAERFDSTCLAMLRQGIPRRDIADSLGCSTRAVYDAVDRARLREAPRRPQTPEPRLVLHFPVQGFFPGSHCPHTGPYPEGSELCCAVCLKSGKDSHPALWIPPHIKRRMENRRRVISLPKARTRQEKRAAKIAAPRRAVS